MSDRIHTRRPPVYRDITFEQTAGEFDALAAKRGSYAALTSGSNVDQNRAKGIAMATAERFRDLALQQEVVGASGYFRVPPDRVPAIICQTTHDVATEDTPPSQASRVVVAKVSAAFKQEQTKLGFVLSRQPGSISEFDLAITNKFGTETTKITKISYFDYEDTYKNVNQLNQENHLEEIYTSHPFSINDKDVGIHSGSFPELEKSIIGVINNMPFEEILEFAKKDINNAYRWAFELYFGKKFFSEEAKLAIISAGVYCNHHRCSEIFISKKDEFGLKDKSNLIKIAHFNLVSDSKYHSSNADIYFRFPTSNSPKINDYHMKKALECDLLPTQKAHIWEQSAERYASTYLQTLNTKKQEQQNPQRRRFGKQPAIDSNTTARLNPQLVQLRKDIVHALAQASILDSQNANLPRFETIIFGINDEIAKEANRIKRAQLPSKIDKETLASTELAPAKQIQSAQSSTAQAARITEPRDALPTYTPSEGTSSAALLRATQALAELPAAPRTALDEVVQEEAAPAYQLEPEN